MATIVLSSVGAAIGNEIVPGIGGQIAGYFGRQAGRWVDTEIGLRSSSASHKDGPRLESLKVQDSRYGIGIPVVFGRVRVAGNVIWISDLIETSHEEQVSGGKGGLFGGGSSSSTRTTYTYSVHCAVAIAAGEIGGVATIWADSKIIYQNGIWKSGVVGNASFTNGTTTQDVNSFLESMIGSGQTPAYRGLAYVVLESLQLANFGNRLPNLTFEVLPASTETQPLWLGCVDAGVSQMVFPLENKGMPPLVTDGSAYRARKMLIGGCVQSGSSAAFSAVDYDVTGNEPLEVTRAQSASVTVNDVTDQAWSMAPDSRFVALYMRGSTAALHYAVIYDCETKQFGNVCQFSMTFTDDTKQLAWLDAQHFILADVSGDHRGVHVFARAGVGVIDLGFYDVWGAGTSTTRRPLFYTQFVPMAGGLLNIMADTNYITASLYVRSIAWQNNGVVIGAPYALASNLSFGSGSGPSVNLLRTAEDEWTLVHTSAVDMHMMSFCPGTASAVITRPWQRLTNTSFSVSTASHPVAFGNRIVMAQRSSMDNYYRLSEVALNEADFSLVVDGAIVGGFENPSTNFAAAAIDGSRLLLMAIRGFNCDIEQLAIIRRCNTGDTLDNIVAGILSRAGYASADYDVSALADTTLDGYAIPEAMSAAAALAPLRVFEPFDLVESGTQLRAVKHGATPLDTIPSTETRATDKPLPNNTPLREEARVQELDLPLEVRVDYSDASRDYDVSTQRARRSATHGARYMAKISLPLVCTADRAKQIAEGRLFTAWAEREQVRLSVSRRYLAVDPGDVIDLGDALMRVVQVKQTGGLLDIVGVLVPPASAVSAANADSGETSGLSNIEPAASNIYLMDLPMLRLADDQPGIYAAVSGVDGWPGATLWRASDGVNYNDIAGFQAAAKAGMAMTTLSDSSPCYIDRASTVNVQLLQGTLSSCTEADLLGGANAALLGNEIIQFQTATLLGPGYYALNNLLRGRKGTESATNAHVIGERFVMLSETSVQFIPALLTDRGRTYNFRALSNGQSLGEAMDNNQTYNLVTLRPLAPAHLTGTRSAGTGSDLTLSWRRRARKNGDWIDYVDVPLDEPSELYDVEIMNGSNVMRTYSGVTSTSQTYSTADQTADWGGSIPSQFTVNVYQISSRYGRGQQASGIV
jgi:hypothetical protein